MRPQKDQDKKDIDQILKKVQKQSSQQKKNITMDLLRGKKPSGKTKKFSYYQLISNNLKENWRRYFPKRSTQQSKNIVMITVFLFLSSYMCWKIEEKYDKMRKKAIVTKSFKRQKIEQENEKIQKYLNKNQFQSVPIKTEQEQAYKYQYQEQPDQFNTKEYLLQAIARDYKAGDEVDQRYEKQLKQKGLI